MRDQRGVYVAEVQAISVGCVYDVRPEVDEQVVIDQYGGSASDVTAAVATRFLADVASAEGVGDRFCRPGAEYSHSHGRHLHCWPIG
jgi:hypothetical protein